MQESLNLYKVLSESCAEKETDIAEIKDYFEVMGKKTLSIGPAFRLNDTSSFMVEQSETMLPYLMNSKRSIANWMRSGAGI